MYMYLTPSSYSVTPKDDIENKEQKYHDPDLSDDDLELDDLDLDVDTEELDGDAGGCTQPLYVLPLYSLLSSDKQASVRYTCTLFAEPHSLVGSTLDLRIGCHWFNSCLGQYSF